jgi:integrase
LIHKGFSVKAWRLSAPVCQLGVPGLEEAVPVRVPSHIYRNRHGGFYFRYVVPRDLRRTVGKSEVRLSLQTEQRREAIILANELIADLPRMAGCLSNMADGDEKAPENIFKLWRAQVLENARLRMQILDLSGQIQDKDDELLGTVQRERARGIVKQAYTTGQLKGKRELEGAMVFPWPPERTKRFSELSSAYLNSFSYRAEGGRKKPLGAKTLEGYQKDIAFFITVMGDVHIGAIDRDTAGTYFNVLRRLPANISRKAEYKSKTIPELLALKAPPQSEYNASKKMERLSGMFKWALLEKRKWGIDANPFEGYGQSGDNATKRRPFTSEELLALLGHPDFAKRQFKTTYSYWLIPLAIFTGARLGELAQLDIKDFVVVDGVNCIDINDIEATDEVIESGRKKRVKTKNAKRLVPVHQELVRLGLLRYVQCLREKKQVHLFPELSRARRDGPAQAASNWFQRFRARVGVTTKQETVFHSFRHGFISNLLDAGVTPYLVAPIVGHEGELITGKVYWNTKDAVKRKPTIDAFVLTREVLNLMPSVEDVIFIRAPGRQVVQRKAKKVLSRSHA